MVTPTFGAQIYKILICMRLFSHQPGQSWYWNSNSRNWNPNLATWVWQKHWCSQFPSAHALASSPVMTVLAAIPRGYPLSFPQPYSFLLLLWSGGLIPSLPVCGCHMAVTASPDDLQLTYYCYMAALTSVSLTKFCSVLVLDY